MLVDWLDIQELRDRYAVVLDGSVTYSRDGAVPGLDGVAQISSHPAYLACHRCLVILGDLGSALNNFFILF